MITNNTLNSRGTQIKKILPAILLLFILLLAAFFRLYRIREYMTFLGDEGRDVMVVKQILVNHKFTLLGPITSVGSMYMGPVFYYFMAPFLWLWGFDPVGPSIMVALFSIATVYLIYLTGKNYLSLEVGLLASFIYAISPLSIIYGRSSWNPNIVPFFSLLSIYSLLKIIIGKKNNWLIVLGLSLGILFQLHYVTLLFIPIVASILLVFKPRIKLLDYIKGIIALIAAYSPFLTFELRHSFVNTLGVWRFLWIRDKAATFTPASFWHTVNDIFVRLFWRLVIIDNAEITKVVILLLVFSLIFILPKIKLKPENKKGILIILLWLFVGLFSFGFYRGIIYDYYFGSLWVAPYLLVSLLIFLLWKYNKITKIIGLALLLLVIYFCLKNSPLKTPPSNLLENTKGIAEFVNAKTGGKKYNFALIAGKNSDHAYRYFLDLWGNTPVTIENPAIDPERKTVTSQLFVVCEEKICQPEGHPLWEIAGFGPAKITDEWQVKTAKVFRLVAYHQ